MSFVSQYLEKLLTQLRSLPSDMIILAVLVIAGIIMIDAFSSYAKTKALELGLNKDSKAKSADGSKLLAQKEYISEKQALAGRPDAIISENGFLIPVERKPFAKKIRDRYVAQLLVYMRLIEEFEGKKPPYGYLILGPKCKQVKIENTDSRQQWLTQILAQMNNIIEGANSIPSPSPKKCPRCEVNKHCQFAPLDQPEVTVDKV